MNDEILVERSPFQEVILSRLGVSDDPDFWLKATAVLWHDVEAELAESNIKTNVYAQIGACSHWLRPHQTRWTAAGGLAWPSGYGARSGASGNSRLGHPQFDWFVLWRWDRESLSWLPVTKFLDKRRLVFRAALPTRTKQHQQAAIHTLWSPCRPVGDRQKSFRIYGFRRISGAWQCVACE